jgi:acetoin utilization deacetylase AcuC-like enzyme
MLIFTHNSMLGHEGPVGHPERPARLAAVLAALEPLGLERREAPWCARDAVERVHPPAFVTAMEAAFPKPGDGMIALDSGDTFLTDGSREAAWRAAGAAVAGVDALIAGQARAVFCAVRPPGHHAEPAQAMGFCIFNNIAIAALHALSHHGLARVAIVDFDVHHGNGSEAVARGEPRLFFASTHQSPLYPGTGHAHDNGAHGNILNVPLPPGGDSAAWRSAMTHTVLPALRAFAPQMLFISAGFDAHRADPLANMVLDAEDFAWGTSALSQAVAGAPVLSSLEGGYDLVALADSASAHVRALLDH